MLKTALGGGDDWVPLISMPEGSSYYIPHSKIPVTDIQKILEIVSIEHDSVSLIELVDKMNQAIAVQLWFTPDKVAALRERVEQ